MKYLVYWTIDGSTEIDAESTVEAENKCDMALTVFNSGHTTLIKNKEFDAVEARRQNETHQPVTPDNPA